jgi:hypothetical protein
MTTTSHAATPWYIARGLTSAQEAHATYIPVLTVSIERAREALRLYPDDITIQRNVTALEHSLSRARCGASVA